MLVTDWSHPFFASRYSMLVTDWSHPQRMRIHSVIFTLFQEYFGCLGWLDCIMHTDVMKIFSDLFSDIRRRNSGDEIFKWWNWTRRKYHASKFKAALFPAVKFPVAKFNAAKISRWGIFCSEVSGSEIYRGENPILKHWKCLILNIWKIVENSIITKERKRLHNFFTEFHVLKG